MAFRKPVRVKDTVRMLAIGDDAIDYDAWPRDAQRAYVSGDDLDVSKIPLLPGATPVWIEIRALGEHEFAVARAAGEGNVAHVMRCITRHGIVSAAGLDGWDGRRHDYCGFRVLFPEDLDLIPEDAHTHLAVAIKRLSALDEEKKSPSGSAPTNPTGAATTTATPSPTAVAPT